MSRDKIKNNSSNFNNSCFYDDGDSFYTECFRKNDIMGEVYATFAKQATAESKFLFTYNLLKKYNKLPIQCKMTYLKNNNKASDIRAQANIKFQNKDYVSAFCEYNKTVMTAKIGSQDYALALANRSAALYHLEEYDDCINDIHHALAAKYPKEIAYKLYDREIKCLQKIGKILQAKQKFNEFLSHLAQSSLSKEKKKNIEIQMQVFLKKSNKENISDGDNKKHEIKLLGDSNKNIPALSKFIKIKYSETMGRCLIVSSDIQPGDVLAIEKSYAGVLKRESFEHNCRNCFKRCLSGVPCFQCTSVIYCDEICRTKSYESGHKYECKIFATFDNWPSMKHMEHLALYIFFTSVYKLGLDKYVTTIRTLNTSNTDPIMRGFNSNWKYLSDEFCSAYTLEGNETIRTINDLFIRHCYAAVLVSFITLAGLQIPNDQLGTVGESLVHLICVVSSNAHEITQPPERKTWSLVGEDRCMPVASLLMPVLSLLNHDCDPNVVRHNYNGTIVLRAIQCIPKDSQLFDNYGKVYATHTRKMRQEMLSNQYCFHCKCKPCEENWPMYETLSNQPQSERIILTNINSNIVLKQSNKLYKIISEMKTMNCNGLQYIQFLYSHLTFLQNNMKKPIKEFCDCQETIKEVLFKTSDKFIIKDT